MYILSKMDPAKLGRGVWQKIFELLNFRDQIQFRAISRYFLQFNTKHVDHDYDVLQIHEIFQKASEQIKLKPFDLHDTSSIIDISNLQIAADGFN